VIIELATGGGVVLGLHLMTPLRAGRWQPPVNILVIEAIRKAAGRQSLGRL
jgi:hypothetical protein